MKKNQAQSILEYTIIIGVIAAAFFLMQKYLQRSVQLSIKVAADGLGVQREGMRERGTFQGVGNYRGSGFLTETMSTKEVSSLRTYEPSGSTDRGHMAVFLARGLGLDTHQYDPNDQSTWPVNRPADIDPNDFGWQEIFALYDAGVANGYPDGLYHNELNMTRDQAAVLLFNAYNYQHPDAPLEQCYPPECGQQLYDDVPQDYWAAGYIYAILNSGIMVGVPMGQEFRPTEEFTRDQVAVGLMRAFSLEPYEGPPIFADVQPDYWAYGAINAIYKAGLTQGAVQPEGRQTRRINETTKTYGSSQNVWYGYKSALPSEKPGEQGK